MRHYVISELKMSRCSLVLGNIEIKCEIDSGEGNSLNCTEITITRGDCVWYL